MKVSKKRSIRLRNAPLKGARQIGANMTEVEHGDLTILYSYETPVAFLSPKGGYVTDKRWSVTTSKHIAKFFDRHGYDRKGAGKVGPQSSICEENPGEHITANDVSVTRNANGYWVLSTIKDGYRVQNVYGDYSKRDAMREFLAAVNGREERGNPAGQLWYPGGVAIGRYKMGEAGTRYYVIPVESTHGWDFPTLVHMFPDNLRPDGLALVEARLGYEHSGQQGYHLFKVRVGGKWSRPMRLRTSLTEIPGVK